MGKAKSQSPLWGRRCCENDARCCVETKLCSTSALSISTPGRSQNGCLVDKTSGTSPNCLTSLTSMTADRQCLTWHSQPVYHPGGTVCSLYYYYYYYFIIIIIIIIIRVYPTLYNHDVRLRRLFTYHTHSFKYTDGKQSYGSSCNSGDWSKQRQKRHAEQAEKQGQFAADLL